MYVVLSRNILSNQKNEIGKRLRFPLPIKLLILQQMTPTLHQHIMLCHSSRIQYRIQFIFHYWIWANHTCMSGQEQYLKDIHSFVLFPYAGSERSISEKHKSKWLSGEPRFVASTWLVPSKPLRKKAQRHTGCLIKMLSTNFASNDSVATF